MRHLVIAALLSGAALGAAHAGGEARLRPSATVIGSQITLGDVIEGAGAAAEVRVASAPPPGQRVLLRRAEIEALASRHGVELLGASPRARIEVVRASQPVPKMVIVEALEEALADVGVEGLFEVELRDRRSILEVAKDRPATVVVEALDLNKRTGRFIARLAAPAGPEPEARARVSGRVVAITEVPVLRRAVAVGAVIEDPDIDWLRLPSDKLNRNIVTDARDLLGKSPRRLIAPGRPVRARDIERPLTIKKGALVTMTLATPKMVITVTGRALDSGAEGDLIRVRNNRSKAVVQGVISGPGQVEVMPRQRLVSAAN
jgi:flagella basal body P-ring formation protein FlgA